MYAKEFLVKILNKITILKGGKIKMKIQEIISILFSEIKAENVHNPEYNTLSFSKPIEE